MVAMALLRMHKQEAQAQLWHIDVKSITVAQFYVCSDPRGIKICLIGITLHGVELFWAYLGF